MLYLPHLIYDDLSTSPPRIVHLLVYFGDVLHSESRDLL